jgi:hypothetical protein
MITSYERIESNEQSIGDRNAKVRLLTTVMLMLWCMDVILGLAYIRAGGEEGAECNNWS